MTGTLGEDVRTFMSFAFIMEADCVVCVGKSEAKEIVDDLKITAKFSL
jgi:hypothetical protein